MQDKFCIHCFITGRVQGVWFRANAREQAMERGLTGWVRNLPDGRVEVMACGDKEKVLTFYEWLKQGPPGALVIEVTYEECSHPGFNQFEIC